MNVRDQLTDEVIKAQTRWREAVRVHDDVERALEEARRAVRAAEAATERAKKRLREYTT